jgi:hypothetical protein
MITTIVTIIGWLWAVGILAALFIIAGAIVVHWTGPRRSGSDPEFLHSPADWEHETGHDCATTTMAMIQTPEVTNVVTLKAQLEAVAAQVEMLARTVRNQAQRIAGLEDAIAAMQEVQSGNHAVELKHLREAVDRLGKPSRQEGGAGDGLRPLSREEAKAMLDPLMMVSEVRLDDHPLDLEPVDEVDVARDTESLCWYATVAPLDLLAERTQSAARWRVVAEGRLDFEV